MLRPHKFAAAIAVALVVPLLTATTAAAVGPKDPPTPVIPQRYLDQPINWSVCSFDATIKRNYPQAPTTNCAKVNVPMDWANPDAHPDVQVAISYSKATGTSRGLMTSNPGGPGGAGLNLTANLGVSKPQLFSDFDLMGFDPRGFGQSTPLQCLAKAEDIAALPVTPDYKERTKLTHKVEVAEAKFYADACSATEFGQFVSSQQTVYDMEFVRALLGSRQLNFIGYSYGTWLGGWYADTYPSRVGRFVLDSNMDWTHTQWDNVNFDPWSGQRRRDTQLFPWIARHADQITGLGATPAQVLAKYNGVRASLTTLVKAGESSVRGDNLDGLIYSASYNNMRFIRATLDILVHDEYAKAPSESGEVELAQVDRAWARLDPALQKYDTLAALRARYGVAAAASTLIASTQVDSMRSLIADAKEEAAKADSGDALVNIGAISTTVRCNDTAWSKDTRFYLKEADKMAKKYDFFGYMNGVPMCAFWKYAPQDRKLDLVGAPRMLIVQSEFDPATSYEGSLRTHKDTPTTTRFVGIDDEGQHGQYILSKASSCVQAIGDKFVFTGELPGKDEVCGTSPLPEDGSVYAVKGPVDGKSVHLPKSKVANDRPDPLLQQVLDTVAASALR